MRISTLDSSSNILKSPTTYVIFVLALLGGIVYSANISFVSSSSSSSSSSLSSVKEDRVPIIMKKQYITTKFEVYGKVQGVFFRKSTKQKADELGIWGWVRNTSRGTVEGEFEYVIQSTNNEIDESHHETFRHWLCNIGSPHSKIDNCTFGEKVVSDQRTYDTFRVAKTTHER
jgi:acylphosphatase